MQMELLQKEELVCMAMQFNLVAVGSRSYVSLLDPRSPTPTISHLQSIDPGQVNLQCNLQISLPYMNVFKTYIATANVFIAPRRQKTLPLSGQASSSCCLDCSDMLALHVMHLSSQVSAPVTQTITV